MNIRAYTSAATISTEDRVLLNGQELRLVGETCSLPMFQLLDGSGTISVFCESYLRDALCDGRLILQRGFFNAENKPEKGQRTARRSDLI
ncbi:hypothetical protein U8Q06_09630 [Rhizobium beringeri]|uniref:hypothetical protein n=1 Tax=Rhizobium TaxID=379 RepID=UPI002E15CF74|nr:hypothetical protein U8Q06_09630 [Rhizobium beringeri]